MKKIILAIILVTLYFSPSYSAFKSGNDLYDYCVISSDDFHEGVCLGYVMGAADVIQGDLNCIPKDSTARQIHDVVINYLKKFPENRHYAASSLILHALKEAFDCE